MHFTLSKVLAMAPKKRKLPVEDEPNFPPAVPPPSSSLSKVSKVLRATSFELVPQTGFVSAHCVDGKWIAVDENYGEPTVTSNQSVMVCCSG